MLDKLIIASLKGQNVGCAKRKLLRFYDRTNTMKSRIDITMKDHERE